VGVATNVRFGTVLRYTASVAVNNRSQQKLLGLERLTTSPTEAPLKAYMLLAASLVGAASEAAHDPAK